MPTSNRKQVIIFESIPMGLSDLVSTLFPHSFPATVIMPLKNIEEQTKDTLEYWLHKKEITQLAGYLHKKRHKEWLGGRVCSKQALRVFLRQQTKQALLPEHHQCRVASTESGRPYFTGLEAAAFSLLEFSFPEFSFPELSISHSRDFATAMISRTHCGIDIQYSAENLHRVKERFCTKEEEYLLQKSLPHLSSLSQLTLLWSGKEAAKKMLSPTGIPGFHELTLQKLDPQGPSNTLLYFTRSNEQNSLFPVAAGILNTSYALALCCQPDKPPHSTVK